MTNLQRATNSIRKGLRKIVFRGSKGKFVFHRVSRHKENKGKVDQAAAFVVAELRSKNLLSMATQRGKEHQQAIRNSDKSVQDLKKYYKSKALSRKLEAKLRKKIDVKALARKLLNARNKQASIRRS